MTLNEREMEALKQLRDAVESTDGKWGCVYLDNCPLRSAKKAWGQVLGTLKKKGLYRDSDDREFKGVFGYVLCD